MRTHGRRRSPIPSPHLARGLAAITRLVPGLALAATLVVVGCSKRMTGVDSGFKTLEGIPSASQLVLFPDFPAPDTVWRDTLNPGRDAFNLQDYILEIKDVRLGSPGVVHGLVFDYTNAEQFQIFRVAANGGLVALGDAPISPAKKWLDTHTDLYAFNDSKPLTLPNADYRARGLIGGVVSSLSPLTNAAQTPVAGTVLDLNYTGVAQPSDSLFQMSWDPVPLAAGYWVQVYILRGDLRTGDEIKLSGAPSPIFAGKSHDLFLAYLPGTVTSYKIGDPVPAGGHILHAALNEFLMNGFYRVRISAIDANSRLIAYTGTNEAFGLLQGVDTYDTFPLGCAIVNPKRRGPEPDGIGGFGDSGLRADGSIETAIPGFRIYPRGVARPLATR